MDSSMLNDWRNQPLLKVSILARLIPDFSYTIPAIGGALSSISLMKVFRALREVENAGATAVMRGMAEATIPLLIFLYLGILLGIVVIALLIVRMLTQTKTASPPSWFFVISGLLFLVPAGLFGEAQSLIIEVLINPRGSAGIAGIASNLNLLLISSILSAPIIFIILTVLSVLPLSARSKPRLGPLLVATAIEILLFAVTIAFQVRLIWLYKS